ncbi:DUF1684 domain-containing protein [Flavobacterium wongokense]|uniref:DUF1684 domain-containing protein n=1 Tax=Flavobacterium wongokense TaxID=2910674 RepID=UPI001F333076|nr:DUF1684 domain-containing protein [Flavobacterium sp. WG47]MCF6132231.1 DUF1684 domain-containing protein [Flavobacterium sp. WG47]
MKKLSCFLFLFNALPLLAQETKVETAKEFQQTINAEYANREESPLTEEDFKVFKGLDFYPISEKFIVEAQFKRTADEKVFKMKTTGTRLPEYVKYGELAFTIDGKAFTLNIYQNIELVKKAGFEDHLFLPFSDLSCGKETYIGGRYIDMRIPKGNSVTIDFNKAYNPYCAYNHKYSCPIVPLDNNLNIEILAGVKKFHD